MPYCEELSSLCLAAKELSSQGFFAAYDGNLSLRKDLDSLFISPSGIRKSILHVDDMLPVSLDGTCTQGKPSSELNMHLTIYRHCPHAKAVIHSHALMATAWSIAQPHLTELPIEACTAGMLCLGPVPILPYAHPGTKDLGNHIAAVLPDSKVMILANHGILTWGESVEEALFGTQRLEQVATLLYYAQQLGGAHPLSDTALDALRQHRKTIGNRIL